MADDLRTTDSGIEIAPLYTAESLNGWDPSEQLGLPGADLTRMHVVLGGDLIDAL